MRRSLAAAAVAGLASLAAVGPVGPAGAGAPAPSSAAQAAPELALVARTPWVLPGGELVLDVRATGTGDPGAFEVFVGVHRQVRTRSAFARSLEGEALGSLLDGSTAPLAELSPGADGTFTLRVPLQAPDQPRDPARVRLPAPGVYPVQVALRELDGGREAASFVTHLVHVVERDDVEALRVVLALPVHSPPSLQPDLTRRFVDGARFAPLARALAEAADVPVVLAPTPETLDAWAASADRDDAAALADLRRAAGRAQVVGLPYVPVDVAALERAGLDGEVTRQRVEGARVVQEVLGVQPDTRTWIGDESLTTDAVQRLARAGVGTFVVPEARLAPIDLLVTLAQPFTLQGPGERRHAAVMADEGLARHFRNGGDQVLAAHHLLADLAVLHFDQPGTPRGVVAMAPTEWDPSAPFLDAVLGGLATSPVVTPSTLDELRREVEPATTSRGRELTRTLEPTDTESLGLQAGEVGVAVARASAFASTVPETSVLTELLPRAILTAESRDIGSLARRRAYLRGAHRRIDEEIGQIDTPRGRSITLTARRGEIPVTFRNRAPYPIEVLVRLESDKLEFPDQAQRAVLLPPNRSHTESFTVETRTSGAFPLRVQLLSPEGSLVIGQTRFTVRSTAASGVGVVLSVGAALFLFVWWIRNFRGRRPPKLVPA